MHHPALAKPRDIGAGEGVRGRAIRQTGAERKNYPKRQAYVEDALASLENGRIILQKNGAENKENIRIAFIYTMGEYVVPQLINKYSLSPECHNVTFSFTQGTSLTLLQELKAGKVDLAICSYIADEPDIDFIPVIQQELVVVTAKDHPLARLYEHEVDLVDTIQPVFRLYEQTCLSESSLWYRKRPGKRTKAAPVLVQETEADTAAAAKAAALLRSEYGRGAIAAYVQGWLGESDVCRSEDIPLKNDKDYVMSLLAVLTGGDRSADFTVQELDGERRENGYAIPELQISRKENNE